MARGDERISQGKNCLEPGSLDDSLWSTMLTSLSQSEKSNPIYGISSEGYSGPGHVQSKSAKAQGINLDGEE